MLARVKGSWNTKFSNIKSGKSPRKPDTKLIMRTAKKIVLNELSFCSKLHIPPHFIFSGTNKRNLSLLERESKPKLNLRQNSFFWLNFNPKPQPFSDLFYYDLGEDRSRPKIVRQSSMDSHPSGVDSHKSTFLVFILYVS